jgi:hypothetical protein
MRFDLLLPTGEAITIRPRPESCQKRLTLDAFCYAHGNAVVFMPNLGQLRGASNIDPSGSEPPRVALGRPDEHGPNQGFCSLADCRTKLWHVSE